MANTNYPPLLLMRRGAICIIMSVEGRIPVSKHIFRQPSFLKDFDYVFTLGFSAPCSFSQKSFLNNSSLCSRAE